jgi:hypothetical protein
MYNDTWSISLISEDDDTIINGIFNSVILTNIIIRLLKDLH